MLSEFAVMLSEFAVMLSEFAVMLSEFAARFLPVAARFLNSQSATREKTRRDVVKATCLLASQSRYCV